MSTMEIPGSATVVKPLHRAAVGTVPILVYHQVTPNPVPSLARYTVSPAAFAAQMRWLEFSGYTSITLDRLLANRREGAALPNRPVVITFDDGFRDLLDHAVPNLVDRGFTATIFMVAGLIGRRAGWLHELGGAHLTLLDALDVQQLQEQGFGIGAHTLTHPRLPETDADECIRQLRGSRGLLEDMLGRAVEHFAYPFGAYNDRVVDAAVQAGYQSACTTRRIVATGADNLMMLPRVSVYRHDSLLDFVWRLRTAFSPREMWRARRRAVRRWIQEVLHE